MSLNPRKKNTSLWHDSFRLDAKGLEKNEKEHKATKNEDRETIHRSKNQAAP
jgi:hypothetical protein